MPSLRDWQQILIILQRTGDDILGEKYCIYAETISWLLCNIHKNDILKLEEIHILNK